ncbi:hypothetical protein trd_A0724 (plasmid) [Thermomicrobium roseum DSM 5159]|uniref:Uncharacterized protein n=1 Tax=Thermomicrobium roseum (strain ATCC 27502 / DSM 5159 / P-2) TaxID=309801 RepID=B9L4L0_THERP|nr:hypothetical protein trd_A0724 [Thermomicrobium roseum DSM 5159]
MGVAHPDARTFFLWGELAYQLGGLATAWWVNRTGRPKQRPAAACWTN